MTITILSKNNRLTEAAIDLYFEMQADKLNGLLQEYLIINSENAIVEISREELQSHILNREFFSQELLGPIQSLKQNKFIPKAIIQAYRDVINDSPDEIKEIILNNFLDYFQDGNWLESFNSFFSQQFNAVHDDIVILSDIKDYSFNTEVYALTFVLTSQADLELTVFIKSSSSDHINNEVLYFKLQKIFLPHMTNIQLPYKLTNDEGFLLLRPLIQGVDADTILTQFLNSSDENSADIIIVLLEHFMLHAALGDILGRNDRHLLNSIIQYNPQAAVIKFTITGFDIDWLLGEKNLDWLLIDIETGCSELNLLSLLDEFKCLALDDVEAFLKRKAYLSHYVQSYLAGLKTIVCSIDIVELEIQQCYPTELVAGKQQQLLENLTCFNNGSLYLYQIFERYLKNFRLRQLYKKVLFELTEIATTTENIALIELLNQSPFKQYLPLFDGVEVNALLRLQCFRGILSDNDYKRLGLQQDTLSWENFAKQIKQMARTHCNEIYIELVHKENLIIQDAEHLLTYIAKFLVVKMSHDDENIIRSSGYPKGS